MADASDVAPPTGVRERKRRETLRRITDAGVRLFIEKGFDGTTVDEVAAAAGISRRTFFHYFDSKDDILLSLQSD
ncbi:TetR family transcriptional regulator, partial [Klebsiella pneumoniae]|uniref:TetR family transcriptional regulator n=1 Tax=Klebsiella pneumoniae TaxID=573 RepID=UPI003D0291F5